MTTRKREKVRAADVEATLTNLAQKVGSSRYLQTGVIVFRLTGDVEGEYSLDCGRGQTQLAKGVAGEMTQGAPLIEVMGDARRIRAILEGKVDGRAQFLAGGIRVRGDLRYLSDLALELGIIKEPL